MEEVRALLGACGPRGVPSNAAQEASAGRWHLKEWLLAVHQRRGVGIVVGWGDNSEKPGPCPRAGAWNSPSMAGFRGPVS